MNLSSDDEEAKRKVVCEVNDSVTIETSTVVHDTESR